MDSHFPMIVGIGTVTTRRHSCAKFEFLGRDSGDARDVNTLVTLALLRSDLVSSLDFLAQFFQWLDLGIAQSEDEIAKDFSLGLLNVFLLIFSGLIVGH